MKIFIFSGLLQLHNRHNSLQNRRILHKSQSSSFKHSDKMKISSVSTKLWVGDQACALICFWQPVSRAGFHKHLDLWALKPNTTDLWLKEQLVLTLGWFYKNRMKHVSIFINVCCRFGFNCQKKKSAFYLQNSQRHAQRCEQGDLRPAASFKLVNVPRHVKLFPWSSQGVIERSRQRMTTTLRWEITAIVLKNTNDKVSSHCFGLNSVVSDILKFPLKFLQ